MTEQKLRKKIAETLYNKNESTLNVLRSYYFPYDGVTYGKCKDIYPDKVENYLEQADQILDILKETLPELAKEAGYVKLEEDQSLPKIPREDREKRKVEVEE